MLQRCLCIGLMGVMFSLAAVADDDAGAGEEEPRGGIYRTTDADGNVVFTDDPAADREVEEIRLREGNLIPGGIPAPRVTEATQPEPPERGYGLLEVTSPSHEQTFHNPYEPIPVTYRSEPDLRRGDRVVLLHDGKALDGMALPGDLLRGPHEVVVEIRRRGEVVKRSDAITIFVHRSSRLNP